MENNNQQNTQIETIDPDNPEINIDDNGQTIYNNWTENNIRTIRNWKINLLKSAYIFSYTLNKYKSKVDRVLIYAMILGYITTIIAGISSALSAISNKYIWTLFGLSIGSLIMNTLVTILNTILKIKNWSSIITKYSVYVDKINNFYSTISNLLLLPDKIKIDAIEFIKTNNKIYLDILMQMPIINQNDYDTANIEYCNYIKNNDVNYTIQQKYGQKDNIIDII